MRAGRVLAGRYMVGEVIGRGGMADVHVGHDTRTGRSVAIKALRSTSAEDPLLRSSLRREAQLLGRVRHHSIVALLDAGHGDRRWQRLGGHAGRSVHRHGARRRPVPA
jgi:serine/threonine-protein kinase